jgi:hypothetical protein
MRTRASVEWIGKKHRAKRSRRTGPKRGREIRTVRNGRQMGAGRKSGEIRAVRSA